jgi:probable biosynthetic protein (TIGR04098 family)
MRARLEQEFGVELDDASWASSRTPSDILSSVLTGSSSSNFEASEATANTPAPFVSGMAKSESASERRTFALSMPQMALKGLSESWLFKEIGDMHWSIIARALRVPSSELRDLEGNRLLATFTRIRVDLDNSAAHFEENQPVTLEARMSRYRSGMFVSTIELSGAQHGGVEVMSNFSRRRQANTNVGLHVSQPIIPRDCSIPFCDEMPAFAVAYRTRRAGVLGDPIFECGYQIQPPHDINGVGLLYFAAYPAIVDISASDYAGRAFTLEMSTRARDVYYFANCEPDDALTFRIHKWKPTRDGIRFESSLSRQSDGVLMAHIVTSKGFV